MSLVFKPKIPLSYSMPPQENKKQRANRIRNTWTDEEIDVLINLRALGVTFRDVGYALGRRSQTAAAKVHGAMLYGEIRDRRKKLIDDILENYNDRKTNQSV